MQITTVQGENKTLVYTITDDTGQPVDLTYLHARWRLTARGDETPLVEKELGHGIQYTDPAGGVLEVTIDPADTDLAPGIYRRELRLTSSGYAQTADIGPLTVKNSLFIED